MSKKEIDDALGAIPQPERIMLPALYVDKSTTIFPEDMLLKEEFKDFIEHTISYHQAKGYHVIEVNLKLPTEEEIMRGTRTLLFKVAKLPKPINRVIIK